MRRGSKYELKGAKRAGRQLSTREVMARGISRSILYHLVDQGKLHPIRSSKGHGYRWYEGEISALEKDLQRADRPPFKRKPVRRDLPEPYLTAEGEPRTDSRFKAEHGITPQYRWRNDPPKVAIEASAPDDFIVWFYVCKRLGWVPVYHSAGAKAVAQEKIARTYHPPDDSPEWKYVAQAAKELRCTPNRIYRLIRFQLVIDAAVVSAKHTGRISLAKLTRRLVEMPPWDKAGRGGQPLKVADVRRWLRAVGIDAKDTCPVAELAQVSAYAVRLRLGIGELASPVNGRRAFLFVWLPDIERALAASSGAYGVLLHSDEIALAEVIEKYPEFSYGSWLYWIGLPPDKTMRDKAGCTYLGRDENGRWKRLWHRRARGVKGVWIYILKKAEVEFVVEEAGKRNGCERDTEGLFRTRENAKEHYGLADYLIHQADKNPQPYLKDEKGKPRTLRSKPKDNLPRTRWGDRKVYDDRDLAKVAQYHNARKALLSGELPVEGNGEPSNGDAAKPRRGGRKVTKRTLKIGKYCYDEMKAGTKRLLIVRHCSDLFGSANPIREASHVTIYARRYAKAVKQPWPIP